MNAHHRAMDQLANRVRALGRFAVLFDDPGLADALVVHYGRSTVDDVAAAARSLAHDRRAVLTLTPASAGESAAGEDAR
ncbi:hypothetical protein GCM10009558_109850 [Virgisporangium aurantiacum]